jgi:uncharacterized protein involved in exopolysaccharide biosynthesis
LAFHGVIRLEGLQMLQFNKCRLALILCAVAPALALRAGHAFSDPTRLASASVLSINEDIKNDVADTPRSSLIQQQLDELTNQLVQARINTVEAKARLDRVDAILNDEHFDPASDSFGMVAETVDPMMTKQRRQYLDYKVREADWSRRFGADHLAVLNLRNAMGEIRRAILDELHRVAEAYRSDYEIAKARSEALSQSLERMQRSSR